MNVYNLGLGYNGYPIKKLKKSMMNHDKKTDAMMLVGRVLIAIIFIVSGWAKITGFTGTVTYTGTVLPFPELMVVIAIILEFVGGIMLLVGYKVRLAAAGLILFTTVAALGFHTNFTDQMQTVHFMKNLAIIGGLLYVKSFGAGAYAIGNGKKAVSMPDSPAS